MEEILHHKDIVLEIFWSFNSLYMIQLLVSSRQFCLSVIIVITGPSRAAKVYDSPTNFLNLCTTSLLLFRKASVCIKSHV